ncbi:MAG TPA: hypothetical protein VGB59_00320 [Allosphingosinicella sp.]|jgi:hypothetical protein
MTDDHEPTPPENEEPYPWDEEPEDAAHDASGPRQRHDAFTEARKAEFLTALVKTGGILDACRVTGISSRTVYRHQQADPRFFDHCAAALRMSATPIELTAWQRAVEGVEQEFACGGQVHVRRRYDSGLLRLLLQGSNPKKYGPRPGFKRKRLYKHEKKQMEREIRAEIESSAMTFEEAIQKLDAGLDAFGARQDSEKLAAGWTETPDGHWIPPGYAPIPGYTPPAGPGEAGHGTEPPGDSM